MAFLPSNMVALSDALCSYWNQMVGTDASTYGCGVVGSSSRATKAARDYQAAAIAVPIDVLSIIAGDACANLETNTDIYKVARTEFAPLLANWKQAINKAGSANVNSVDSFATYYNYGAGGAWNTLWNPIFREIFYAVYGVYPSSANTFYEILKGSRFVNAMGYVQGSTFTDGASIDGTKYAGGVAYATFVSGTSGHVGNFTVTGTWRKVDGTTHTANATVPFSLPSDPYLITPPSANELLIDVTNIVSDGSANTGTGKLYIEAHRPAGRPTYSWESNL